MSVLLAIKTKLVILFYVYFEIRVVPISLMLFLFGYQPEKLQRALLLTLYTVMGSFPLLLFIVFVDFGLVSSRLSTVAITLPFLVKTPMYLFHL